MQPVNTFILIKQKIPATDHPRAAVLPSNNNMHGCVKDVAQGGCMQRPGWWPVCQLCCSLPASPDHLPQQRSEKAGEEEEGHVAGREAWCHRLLKIRVVCLD